MEPDKAKARKNHRDEYEVAYSTKELGRPIQRKMQQQQQQQQMEASGSTATASHGEDSSFDTLSSPPQSDRAG